MPKFVSRGGRLFDYRKNGRASDEVKILTMVAIRQLYILVGDLIHPSVITLAVAANCKDCEGGSPDSTTDIGLVQGEPIEWLTHRPASSFFAAR